MPLLDNGKKPMKPAEYAEHRIIEAILDKSYGAGDALPGERALAQSLGVTRPTLRETLQRLGREGWVTIAHGKPTRVNDYLTQGGLGILTTLARYGDYLSSDLIVHLLKTRTLILPGVAREAIQNDADAILAYLSISLPEDTDPVAFTRYDWGLQILMVEKARNPVLGMIYNDFSPVYHVLCDRYFSMEKAKKQSKGYYKKLATAIRNKDEDIRELVEASMQDALTLWEAMP